MYYIKETKQLFEALAYNIEHTIQTNKEYQLTDGLMHMIDKGTEFKSHKVDNWYDLGKSDVLLQTNKILLKKHAQQVIDQKQFENSIIIPPVSIGVNCTISNSIIGPYVSISDNARIESSTVTDSIIGSYASLQDAVLANSIIGNDSSVKGFKQSLNIGDNTEIDLSK